MSTQRSVLRGIAILAIVVGLAAPASVPVRAQGRDDSPRAYPALLEMARERPYEKIRVIVQRRTLQHLPDQALERLGGRLGKRLPLVGGVALELPARAVEALARHPGVRWISLDAPLASATAPAGLETVRDEFPSASYAGNAGSQAWADDWSETGESTSASSGLIQVVSSSNCFGGSGRCLRLDPYTPLGKAVSRRADLGGAVAATLSLYRNNQLNANSGSAEEVRLEISSDGGQTWATLRAYSSTQFLGAGAESFDITAYVSADTRLRFVISGQQSGARYFYVDNIQIAYAVPSPYTAIVGADEVRNDLGLDGAGVTVAVVDSGIAAHPDLQAPGSGSRIVASAFFGNFAEADDGHGHGAHVAGIIAGNGGASGGRYQGIAPGVNLINVKVLNAEGQSYTSDLVAALQWVYDHRTTYNIRVVNISLNSSVPESYHTSPINAAVEILWLNGVVVVVSAGNNGQGSGPVTLYPPANDPFAITVGATEDRGTADLFDDRMASFSAYGVTEDGFAKPDLVAPGRNIVSLLAGADATVYAAHPAHRVNAAHFRMSGTSMSAPMVTGIVALLLQSEPGLTPDQVKYRLLATANAGWPGYETAEAGAGYPDAYSAMLNLTTESANVGLIPSQLLWTGDDPVAWDSVNWNSVNWNSVNWNSVNWNSVNWNSVNWNSSLWDD